MKNHHWLVIFLLISGHLQAQNFPGYRASNYAGVNSVFFNPASIADSKYRWDLNLFSAGAIALNNNATINFKELRSFEDDKVKTQLFGKDAGPASGLLSADFTGPSVLFNAGKMSFAVTTRVRTMINATNLDGKLASKIIDQVSNDDELPYGIQSDGNMTASANAWKELGVSAARVLSDKGAHFFKGGISVKYLSGSANGNIYVKGLDAMLNENAITKNYVITNASGIAGVSMSGATISEDFSVKDLLSFHGSGAAADLGFVYEYRPAYAMGDKGYKIKAGVALVDAGSIKYKQNNSRTGVYNIEITGPEEFDLASLYGINLTEFNSFLAARPEYFTDLPASETENINVALPATLQLDVDYHLTKGFYISAAGQLAVNKIKNKPQNNQYYNGFTLTPRYEGKKFGLYVPLNYNKLTRLNAGISLRTGPFFIGSGSCLTALLGNSKQADFHFGVHVSSFKKK